MAVKIAEYTDNLGVDYLVMTTMEGQSYLFPRTDAFGIAWQKTLQVPTELAVVARPPAGRSLTMILVATISPDSLAVNTTWYNRGMDGVNIELGTTNIALGQSSGVMTFADPFILIPDGGALVATTTGLADYHGLYAIGWII